MENLEEVFRVIESKSQNFEFEKFLRQIDRWVFQTFATIFISAQSLRIGWSIHLQSWAVSSQISPPGSITQVSDLASREIALNFLHKGLIQNLAQSEQGTQVIPCSDWARFLLNLFYGEFKVWAITVLPNFICATSTLPAVFNRIFSQNCHNNRTVRAKWRSNYCPRHTFI